jgi:hypothetical protein
LRKALESPKESLSSNGSESLNESALDGGFSRGIKFTSTAALKALNDAQLREDDDSSTERFDPSVMKTASTRTSVDSDPPGDAKPQACLITTRWDDFRSKLRNASQYIISLQDLEEKMWDNSSILCMPL